MKEKLYHRDLCPSFAKESDTEIIINYKIDVTPEKEGEFAAERILIKFKRKIKRVFDNMF
jgi:hypothetical protein